MPIKTAILCRTNAPLIKCAFDLIKAGRNIKVQIIGRDVAKKLKEVIGEVLGHRRNCPINEFLILLEGWINQMRSKYGNSDGTEAILAECEDMFGCLQALSLQAKDAMGLHGIIDSYFVDRENASDADDVIVLASGHRSKGLEWERVIILRPDLLPHPSAETEADLRQEEHIEYIMKTRAKKQLIVCNDSQPD